MAQKRQTGKAAAAYTLSTVAGSKKSTCEICLSSLFQADYKARFNQPWDIL
jgi:hypothetical protein